MFFGQRSIVFPRVINDRQLIEKYRAARVEIVSDDERLEGWLMENPQAANDVTLIYFGGNAEDILATADASGFDARHLLFVNYRGYGRSTGSPSQSALYADAMRVYDFAKDDSRLATSRILLVGRSLGSAMAVMLAAKRAVAGVVLITPFDNLASVAAHFYPLLPVRWLTRDRFPSEEWARGIEVPVLVLAARRDAVVPYSHAQKLFDAWHGPKEFRMFEEVGHNDIQTAAGYYGVINQFLAHL
jgi:fermentation-respiration switch protein FrsA (DUF1100 family)